MKILTGVGEGLMATVAIISMYSYSLDFLPGALNTLLLGGGAGLLAATVFATQKGRNKSEPIGEVGALPGVPEKQRSISRGSKGKTVEKERLMRRYDRAFAEMVSRHGPDSRMETLEKIKPILYELSPDLKAWTGDVRIRVYLLMQEIAKDLDNPAYAKASLGLLVLILSKGGNSATEMAKPIFREKVLAMYQDQNYNKERFLPRLMLMLDGYDPLHIEKLTKEAIHAWGDERFRAAGDFLGLDELDERGLRNEVKGILGGEIARAGNDRDMTALNRAVELYHAVK